MDRKEIVKELRRLARSRNNDGVKLAYLGEGDLKQIDRLDLRGVAEVKRGAQGGVEVRFLDKLRVLEMLEQLCQEEDQDAFLAGLREGEPQ